MNVVNVATIANVAIVGCGLIGHKRRNALGRHRLVIAADTQLNRARHLIEGTTAQATADWRAAVAHPDVDIVIVAATNDVLAEISRAAVQNGKHVLVEKPAGRTAAEIESIIAAQKAAPRPVLVKAGFNHRFHPAIIEAKRIFDAGDAGPLMFLRGRYGHGGRLGYEKEWRADPTISGGGELLDQGVHLIDLARWFAGDFTHITAKVATFFWDMPVEDNAFLILTAAAGQVAFLHASCSEWKNLFSLEIYGRAGKLQIDGLGGSYGVEKLTWYKMLPEMGPPQTTASEFPAPDESWKREFDHFVDCIHTGARPLGDIHDALAAVKIVQAAYGVAPL